MENNVALLSMPLHMQSYVDSNTLVLALVGARESVRLTSLILIRLAITLDLT